LRARFFYLSHATLFSSLFNQLIIATLTPTGG
jgi:hypothetical protein